MDIDTSLVLEIKLSRWVNWARLAGSGLFVIVAAIWFAESVGWIEIGKHARDSSGVWISGPILLFFGAIFVAVAAHLYRLRGSVITLSPEGFRDLRIAAETVPWSAIERVTHQKEMIVLETVPGTGAKLNFTILVQILRRLYWLFGLRGLIVNPSGTALSSEELLAAILAYGNAWHSSGSGSESSPTLTHIDTFRTLEFRLCWREWLAKLIMGAFGMLITGFLLGLSTGLILIEGTMIGKSVDPWLQGIIAILVGGGSALYLGEFYRYSGAVVTLSPGGFRDLRVAAEILPWGAIEEISVEHGPLVLKIAPEIAAQLGLRQEAVNLFHQAGGFVIDPKGLTVSLKELFEATVAYAQTWHEASGPAGTP